LLIDLDIKIEGKHFILFGKHMPGNFKEAGSDNGTIENSYKSHLFNWLESSNEHCLDMLMDLDWPYQKLRESTSFYLSNTFLEAFLKF